MNSWSGSLLDRQGQARLDLLLNTSRVGQVISVDDLMSIQRTAAGLEMGESILLLAGCRPQGREAGG